MTNYNFKKTVTYAIVGLFFLISLTACGNESIVDNNELNNVTSSYFEDQDNSFVYYSNSDTTNTDVINENNNYSIIGSWRYSDSVIYHFNEDLSGSIDYYNEDGSINVVTFTYSLNEDENIVSIMYDSNNGISKKYELFENRLEMSNESYERIN